MQKISLVLWILPLISIASNDEFDSTAVSFHGQSMTTHPPFEKRQTTSDSDGDFRLGIDGKVFVSPFDRVRNVILKHLFKMEKKSFIGLIIIPYIVCFFAAKGVWPFYPSGLQYQVNEMGKKLFTQSDDKIRQFCRGKFNFPDTCYRPDIWQSPTDCAFTLGTSQPSQSSWGDNGARLVKNNAKKTAQKQNSYESFGSTSRPSVTSPTNHLENLDNDKQPPPNINIAIHNVFSFNDKPKNVSASISPISHAFDNRFQIPYPSNQSNVFYNEDDFN